jgi:hypothetical protein
MANEEKTPGQKMMAELDKLDKERSGRYDHDLIQRHREAGVSMFGSHPNYPGEMVEVLPDGRWFIIKKEDGQNVRVREVEPWVPENER